MTAATPDGKTTERLAAAPAPLLDIDELSVAFPRYGAVSTEVLRDVNLSLNAGEVLGLVGESGSGKTMIARAIMKLIPPPGHISKGAIRFAGTDLARLDDEALRKIRGRDIAMIISNPRGELDPLQTVGQQIGNILRYHSELGRRAIRERVLDLLRQVSIPDRQRRVDAYPHELSGGMAQRVVIAIALACSPQLIISDDATSGLDVTVQAQVLELIRNTRQSSAAHQCCSSPAMSPSPRITATGSPFSMPAKSWNRRPRRVLRRSSASLYCASACRLRPQRAAAALLAWRRQGPARTARRARSAARSRTAACASRNAAATTIPRSSNGSRTISCDVTFRWSVRQ